jgi:hypothetical protein
MSMKILASFDTYYTVVVAATGKTVFTSHRSTCIDFIKAFDLASPQHVDLRLVNQHGEQEDWHNDPVAKPTDSAWLKGMSDEIQNFVSESD